MSKLDRKLRESSPLQRPVTQPTRAEVKAGMSRRQFLGVSFSAFAAASLAKFGIAPTREAMAAAYYGDIMPNGVAAGEVTQNSAILWAHSTAPGAVTFEYATAEDFSTVLGTLTAEVTEPMLPVKVEVSDLQPATDYFYRASDTANCVAVGRFRTPAAAGTFAGLRFGVSGDWRGELAPYPAVSNVTERDLEFFVGLGDTIYSDFPSPALESEQALSLADFRIKHNEGYSARFGQNYWSAIRSSMAFIPTIDDHEVSNDFAGGAEPSYDPRFADYEGAFVNETELYKNGLQAYVEYNPVRDEKWSDTDDPLMEGKPKLYRRFNYGSDAAIFVLDNRSFRNAPLPPLSDLENRIAIFGFLAQTFNAERTMLGLSQLEALLADLQQAQDDGVTWKFVIVPDPIQNLGLVIAEDRYEGYAAERSVILKFIADNAITNVVFISADIHGSLVNDLSYQEAPLGEALPTNSFEITTGSVAFDAPFGPTVVDLGHQLGLFTDEQIASYRDGDYEAKESFIAAIVNAQAEPLNYPLVGLESEINKIDFELIKGPWTATNVFGWTEFDIDAETQALHITTYGIAPYSRAEIQADPDGILARKPEIVQEFIVRPVAE